MDGWTVLEQAAELARRGEAFALATVVWRQGPSSSKPGSRAIITADGQMRGWIGGACAEPAVVRAAHEAITSGDSALLLLGQPDQFPGARTGERIVPISCQSEGALEVYIEPVLPVPRVVVVGTSPMAHTLTELAGALGWRANLIGGQDFRTTDADQHTLVVVATQGHDDEGVLERAAAARPAYLGLVGSRKRGMAVLGYLADRGVPQEQLDRVRVPAGLDLGRTTHAEIAVAILAELVQFRASATGLPGTVPPGTGLPGTDLPAPAGREQAELADPVCGMPVTTASPSLELDGVTYYFCSVGCRDAFEKREARC
jgi:xanthine dehydrogenase accessory factor